MPLCHGIDMPAAVCARTVLEEDKQLTIRIQASIFYKFTFSELLRP
jgi:hypothetical protein